MPERAFRDGEHAMFERIRELLKGREIIITVDLLALWRWFRRRIVKQ